MPTFSATRQFVMPIWVENIEGMEMNDIAGKGYIYAELEVYDDDKFYGEYMPRVRPVLDAYGAKFLVAGGNPRVIEGDRTVKRIVLIQFNDPETAQRFFYSKDYQDIIGLRYDSANTHLYFFDGPEREATA